MHNVRIGDIADFQKGFAFKSKDYQNEGVRIIRVTNLNKNDFSDNNCLYIDPEKAVEYEKYSLRSNDAVISTVGSWPTNPDSVVGKVCIIPKGIDGSLLNQNSVRLRAKEGCKQLFLNYALRNKSFSKYIVGTAQGSANQASITLENIRNYEFFLPEVEVQEKIISILNNLDQMIITNTEINQNLEQQAAGVFYERFITNADPSWREGTISDLGIVVGGSTPSKAKPEYYTDHGIAWITPKDLSVDKSKFISHGADNITELGLRNSSASIMPSGTVLFSSRAPIGYIAIADGEVTTNQGFKSVVPHENVGTAFVYYLLKNALPTIENMASGSTFKEISGSSMKNVPAIVPDNVSLKAFADFCDSIFQEQRTLEAENRRLSTIRDTLLPKLMSGELDVSEIEL